MILNCVRYILHLVKITLFYEKLKFWTSNKIWIMDIFNLFLFNNKFRTKFQIRRKRRKALFLRPHPTKTPGKCAWRVRCIAFIYLGFFIRLSTLNEEQKSYNRLINEDTNMLQWLGVTPLIGATATVTWNKLFYKVTRIITNVYVVCASEHIRNIQV